MNQTGFRKDLEHIINCNSMEGGSDTPDFILAEYLADCLQAYDRALAAREKWYGRTVMGNGVSVPTDIEAPNAEPTGEAPQARSPHGASS